MKALLLLTILLTSSHSFCQNILDSVVSEELDFPIYSKVEKMPEFLIGKAVFSQYLEQNLRYPLTSLKNGIEGTVMVAFIVNEDSTISDHHIIKGINPELNAEALRLTKLILKMAPGSIADKNVKVILSLPIEFSLNTFDSFKETSTTKPSEAASVPVVDNQTVQLVEQMPEFPGGDEALMKFINTHIRYPAYELQNDIQGWVVVGFIVNKDGSISDISIKKGVSRGINSEAVRVVSLLPNFKPGRSEGVPVRVAFVLPITFKLESLETYQARYGSYTDHPFLLPSKH